MSEREREREERERERERELFDLLTYFKFVRGSEQLNIIKNCH